jgi:hypothetical protein
MKNYTAVILTPRNAIVEKVVTAPSLAIAAGLANTLYRGNVLTIVED